MALFLYDGGDLVDVDHDDDGDADDDFDFEPFHSNSRRLVHCSGTRRVHAIHSTRAGMICKFLYCYHHI